MNAKTISKFVFLLLLVQASCCFAQNNLDALLTPADTLNKPRRTAVILSESALAGIAFAGFYQSSYKNYTKTDFGFVDNSAQWLQMDKAGLVFSSYHIGNAAANALQWSGVSKKNQLLYGATLGFVFLSTLEVFDGYSKQVGASWTDVAANAAGTGLYVSQELLWNEQRIVPKFSFHASPYAAVNPNQLGTSFTNQIFNDYNGQTYWLSVNLHSFFKQSKIPKWLNVALGYGAEGMITANDLLVNTVFFPEKERTRQFYLSFDVNLTKIPTKNRILKTIFSVFNTLKIPAPTFEINSRGASKFRLFYF